MGSRERSATATRGVKNEGKRRTSKKRVEKWRKNEGGICNENEWHVKERGVRETGKEWVAEQRGGGEWNSTEGTGRSGKEWDGVGRMARSGRRGMHPLVDAHTLPASISAVKYLPPPRGGIPPLPHHSRHAQRPIQARFTYIPPTPTPT